MVETKYLMADEAIAGLKEKAYDDYVENIVWLEGAFPFQGCFFERSEGILPVLAICSSEISSLTS